MGLEAEALRRPQPPGVHVPAIPTGLRQLVHAQDADQPEGGVWHQHLAGNPVPDRPGRDVKFFPRLFGCQTRIEQQNFEAFAQRSTHLAGILWADFSGIVVDTMYIMLSIRLV